MKPKRLFLRSMMIVILVAACVGFASAQTVSNDLLQTGTGTQEDLSSWGLEPSRSRELLFPLIPAQPTRLSSTQRSPAAAARSTSR